MDEKQKIRELNKWINNQIDSLKRQINCPDPTQPSNVRANMISRLHWIEEFKTEMHELGLAPPPEKFKLKDVLNTLNDEYGEQELNEYEINVLYVHFIVDETGLTITENRDDCKGKIFNIPHKRERP